MWTEKAWHSRPTISTAAIISSSGIWAIALNGTEKQFNVGWSKESNAIVLNAGQPYAAEAGLNGQAGQSTVTAVKSDSKVFVDQTETAPEAYNISGNNFFKLRDIAGMF